MDLISFPLIVTVIGGVGIAIVTFIISQKDKTPKWATLLIFTLSIFIVIGGMGEALVQSKTDKEILNSITGGDGFCYIAFDITLTGNKIGIYLISKGKYPLYDISVRIVDITKIIELKSLTLENLNEIETKFSMKNIYPGTAISLGTMDKNEYNEQNFNVFFIARNGQWTQEIRMRSINNDQFTATRVLKGKNKLYEFITQGFPLNKNNKVDW